MNMMDVIKLTPEEIQAHRAEVDRLKGLTNGALELAVIQLVVKSVQQAALFEAAGKLLEARLTTSEMKDFKTRVGMAMLATTTEDVGVLGEDLEAEGP